MASFKGDFKSQALNMDTALNVILPFDHNDGDSKPCKVIYLLHGQGSASASWMRWTSIERYAMKHKIAVIMPEVQRSFYTDMAYGRNYYTYVAEELPQVVAKMFNISTKREDSYIAGLSMGGFGALKIGLNNPDKYAGIGSFSGAVDLARLRPHLGLQSEYDRNEIIGIFGPDAEFSPMDDFYTLSTQVATLPQEQRPKIFLTCGSEDEMPTLLEGNHVFRDHVEKLPLDFKYMEWPGTHEWGFWDVSVQHALNFFLGE